MERVMGIEPTRPAWKAGILAIELHPRRTDIILSQKTAAVKIFFEFFGNFHFLVNSQSKCKSRIYDCI